MEVLIPTLRQAITILPIPKIAALTHRITHLPILLSEILSVHQLSTQKELFCPIMVSMTQTGLEIITLMKIMVIVVGQSTILGSDE